ncbi:MAG: peptidoglycan DD-metalloendopeptidase family protein [Bacteroidales bacterium]|nr:peptidoglycan DD-metalloendopeptidase family protein [Candidatus Cacconaster caballi]
MRHFVFDRENMKFRPRKAGMGSYLRAGVRYLALSLLIAVVCYVLLALLFSTDHEKKLMEENRRLKAECERLEQDIRLVDKVVDFLSVRDHTIYRDIFDAEIPLLAGEGVPDSLYVDWTRMDEFSDKELICNTAKTARSLEYSVNRVNYWIAVANQALGRGGVKPTSIPSIVPIPDFKTLQAGASVGRRVNPFFKTMRDHQGMDLMAPVGTDVLCTADGVVTDVVRSGKGMGNTIEVVHDGGFITKYSHLGEIRTVRKGQTVKQGDVIGKVGMSGMSFASCLHYEIWRNGRCQDPADYFFAELNPLNYSETVTVSQTTGQSMD